MLVDQTQAPKMNITLPRLSVEEVAILAKWCDLKREVFPMFGPWLADVMVEEIARRDFPDIEPEMMTLPNWNGEELADALIGSHVLRHFPMTEPQVAFVDQLHLHCLTNAAAALQQFSSEVKL